MQAIFLNLFYFTGKSHMAVADIARVYMFGAHMAGASHVTHISRSQIKFILLLLLFNLPKEISSGTFV